MGSVEHTVLNPLYVPNGDRKRRPKKVRRAVESFHSFQSAGEDEMFLALLQRELDNIMETHSTFSEPVLLGAGDQAKLYRPISHFFS